MDGAEAKREFTSIGINAEKLVQYQGIVDELTDKEDGDPEDDEHGPRLPMLMMGKSCCFVSDISGSRQIVPEQHERHET